MRSLILLLRFYKMSLYLNLKLRTISNGFAGLSLAMVMSACASNPKDVMAPELTFKASASECANKVDFSNPIALEDKEKTRKKAMRARRVVLTSFMGDEDTDCIVGASGEVLPYASFELPTGMKGRVVSAGAVLDQKVIFAADVTTYDINGQKVRHFDRDEFRRFGGIYGVQFKPKTNETYVVIQADPALVGETNNTVETSTTAQYIAIGTSSGTNTLGSQTSFDRSYAYNGNVVVRTVFPKQEK